MELKLFLTGCAVAALWQAFRHLIKTGKILEQKTGAVMHGLFGAAVAFIAMLLLSVSMQSRVDATMPAALSKTQLLIWLLAVIAAFCWNFFRYREYPPEQTEITRKNDTEWAETIASALLLASVVMFFLVQAFRIPSPSMYNTLQIGDHLFVNKIAYGVRIPGTGKRLVNFEKIQRGDVIVFRFPSDDSKELQCGGAQYDKDFIKRVIGVPGDSVEVRNGAVIVNGQTLSNESYALYTDTVRIPGPKVDNPIEYQRHWEARELGRMYGETIRDSFGPVTVPAGHYFAMGDNRDHSCDSRFWGPVPEQNVKGKAWFIYWPPAHMKGVD
jgi:signal peptidase I